MDDFTAITVKPGRPSVKIKNPTGFQLIGRGSEGAVFKLSSKRCVKIYATPKKARWESEILKTAKSIRFLPILYKSGPNYNVMEYIKGPSLHDYLQSKQKLPERITKQIIFILKEMKRLGFRRIDLRTRHIIVTNRKKLKVVDHVSAMVKRTSKPHLLFTGLKKVGLLETFLLQVKELDEKTYCKWR